MSEGSVTERRLRPIQDAIASYNWKQALKECEKWQKKGEKSDKFLALKAYVLVNQADPAQTEKGESETLQLCSRNPAVTDFDTIHILQDALRDLSLEAQEGGKLWERAASAKPGDKAILMTWLNRGIEDSQWQTAQKAAMALRKAFPTDRNYDFWNILLCFLVERDDRATDKERTLFGTLAYRLVSKAAEAAPTDQNGITNPGKGIVRPEEVALLVEIFMKTNHEAEAVELLTGPTMNTQSKIGLQDPQLIMSLSLQCLSAATDVGTRLNIAKILIKDSAYHGDDRLWAALKDIHLHGDHEIQNEAAQLMDQHLPKDDIRHRSFLVLHHSTPSDRSQLNLSFCKEVIARDGTKPPVFRQLRENIEVLNEQDHQDLVSGIDASSLSSQIFVFKVGRLTSPLKTPSGLISQAAQALDIYNQSIVSGNPSPECVVIAAQSLIQLAFSSSSPHSQIHLLRAAAILALSSPANEEYFPIPVLLLHLYQHLGLFSLAFSTFVSLSVKNLQWETVGHLILTRIGTLHPHRPHDENVKADGKSEPAFEPAGGLDSTLQVAEKIVDGIGDSVQRGLRDGSYSNIINAVDTRKKIDRSLWRRVCAVEEQKVARLTADVMEVWHALEGDDELKIGDLVDQRDTAFIPNYSPADLQLWRDLQCGPTPNEGWVAVMTLQERVLNCFSRGKSGWLKDTAWGILDREWSAVEEAEKRAEQLLPDKAAWGGQLTRPEQEAYHVLKLVLGVVKSTRSSEKVGDEAFGNVARALSALVDEQDQSVQDTNAEEDVGVGVGVGVPWQRLHSWYVAVETAHLVHAFSTWSDPTNTTTTTTTTTASPGSGKASKGGKKGASSTSTSLGHAGATMPQAQRKTLSDAAADVHGKVQSQARGVKGRFGEGGVLGRVLEAVLPATTDADGDGAVGEVNGKAEALFAEQFSKFVDGAGWEAALETLVGRWLASWEDACEGVLGVVLLGMDGGRWEGTGEGKVVGKKNR